MTTTLASNPVLKVRDLTLTFGGVRAISGLNLDVHAGEVLAIIGPNGAGKTSTLNAITRVFDVSGGQILFKEQDLANVPRHRIAQYGIARTFQNIELFDAATVMDNLLLGRHRFNHGQWWQQILRTPEVTRLEEVARADAESVIEFLDLSAWRNSTVSSLPYACARLWSLVVLCAPSQSCCFWTSPPLASTQRRRVSWLSGSMTSELIWGSRWSWWSTTCRWSAPWRTA